MASEHGTKDQVAVDRAWRVWSSVTVGGVLIVGALLGFIAIPLVQRQGVGIDSFTAICRAIGLLPGTPAAPQPAPLPATEPVSIVAWTGATLRTVQDGSATRGATTVTQVCAGCHGEHGLSVDPQFPQLAGQSAYAIYKQLHDYKTGARVNAIMSAITGSLNDQQMADVAAYYDRQPGLQPANSGTAQARRLVERGDVARDIPPCASCHARGTGGPIESPWLVGQYKGYLAQQLQLFRSHERHNDLYARMRTIAGALTPAEITQLSDDYAATRR